MTTGTNRLNIGNYMGEPGAVKGWKVAYDPRVSLNTIIMCLTVVGGAMAVVDKISANATTSAVAQSRLAAVEQAIVALNSQRNMDRQELLSELRDIKSEIKIGQLAASRK